MIKIKEIVNYTGLNVKSSGFVELSLEAMFDQIIKSIELLQLIDCNIKVKAKIPGNDSINLGSFKIKCINFDGKGLSKIKLDSVVEAVEMENLNKLILKENFAIMFIGEEKENNDEE